MEEKAMATPAVIRTPRANQVSGAVVDAALKVHSQLGPGLLESAYQPCLAHELRKRGFHVATQVGLPVVEIKCVDGIHPVHDAQLLSYLRLGGKSVGLLIKFHVPRLKDGIRRMVDGRDWER
jgi:hypothetical protein